MNYEVKDVIKKGLIQYVIVSNSDNKVWIMPCKNMKVGINLYQPSALKGKVFKEFIPYIYKNKLIRKKIGIEIISLLLEECFINKMESIFGMKELEYSFFLGTPSIHQKVTIQIFKENKILGYCKVSNNSEVVKLFNTEKDILDYLYANQVNNVPKCLFTGNLTSDTSIFVQSTIKSCKAKSTQELNNKHIDFLKEMEHKTKIYCTYEESDYKKSIDELKRYIEIFKDYSDKKVILDAITIVEDIVCNQPYFSMYHNDFTPWNMFFEKENLFVFDFEYAKKTYPPLIDIFHFYTQVAIYVKKKTATEIYQNFNDDFMNGKFKGLFSNPIQYYMYYLLDIISLYISRDKGQISTNIEHNIKIWIELLRNLNESCNNKLN